MLTLAVLVGLGAQVPGGGPPSAPTLSEVLDAYARHLERIRSIEAVYGEYLSLNAGRTWTQIGQFRFWKDGPRRRFERWTNQLVDQGGNLMEINTWSDHSWSPEDYRILQSPGRRRPDPPTSPENLYWGPIASLMKPNEMSMSRVPDALLMLTTSYDLDFPEDVRRDKAATIAAVGDPERPEVEIQYVSSFHTARPLFYRVTLDPARDFAIRRVEQRRTPKGPVEGDAVVEEFAEVEPGLFFPARNRITTKVERTYERRMISLRVNRPVDPGSLVVEFPEGTLVGAEPLDTTHIWGKSGPRRTFHNRAELDAYRGRILGDYQLRSLIGFGLLVMVLMGIAAIRHRRGDGPPELVREPPTSEII